MGTVPVEAVLVAALSPVVACASQVPTRAPAEFCKAVSQGGPPVRDIVLDEAAFTLEVTAQSQARAGVLACALRDRLRGLSGRVAGAWVLGVQVDRPVFYADATSGTPRYLINGKMLLQDA